LGINGVPFSGVAAVEQRHGKSQLYTFGYQHAEVLFGEKNLYTSMPCPTTPGNHKAILLCGMKMEINGCPAEEHLFHNAPNQ
jgi:hypothetical protein